MMLFDAAGCLLVYMFTTAHLYILLHFQQYLVFTATDLAALEIKFLVTVTFCYFIQH